MSEDKGWWEEQEDSEPEIINDTEEGWIDRNPWVVFVFGAFFLIMEFIGAL